MAEKKAASAALGRAQEKAPKLTAEFVDKHGLTDDDLDAIAVGLVSPPPVLDPDDGSTELHRTDGGWQVTPKGSTPEDVQADILANRSR